MAFLNETESESVAAFRYEQYLRMGFSAEEADEMCWDQRLDWHRVEALLDQIRARKLMDPHRLTFLIVT